MKTIVVKPAGFTLVELLLVVVIMAIAAAVAVPNFARTGSSLELRTTAEQLADTIRYGQLRAMTKCRVVRLNVDRNGYWLEEDCAVFDGAPMATKPKHFQPVDNRWGRRNDVPGNITLIAPENGLAIAPNGVITRAQVRLCRDAVCMVVSTEQQRGKVVVGEQECQ